MSDSVTPVSKTKLQFFRAVFADAVVALFATFVFGCIIASLAAAGTITMGLAYGLLISGWVIAIVGSFVCPWPISNTHRVIFGALLAFMLALVGWFEARHYEPTPSAKDIASEIAKVLPSEHIQEQTTEYAGLSNSRLRNRVFSFTTEMRKIETEYTNKQSEINQMGIPDPMRPLAEREKLWMKRNTETDAAKNEEKEVFHSRFISESRSLHFELLKRLALDYPKLPEEVNLRNMQKINYAKNKCNQSFGYRNSRGSAAAL